ncbi:MAG: peptidylprolyl isomerase [Clostridia bacterium]
MMKAEMKPAMKRARGIVLVVIVLTVLFAIVGCNQATTTPQPTTQPTAQATAQATAEPTAQPSAQPDAEATTRPTTSKNPKVQIEMMDGGKMVFQLYPKFAPQTVANFVKLANEKYFDGLKFHRIMKTFMVQGGDGASDPSKPALTPIYGEFSNNGFAQNTLSHVRGVISMAILGPDSATSQFFIVTKDSTFLDGNYAAFGKMISGQETLDTIANTPVDPSGEGSVPTVDVVMKSVTVVG